MAKDMTPMQRFNSNIKTFKEHLSTHFTELTLNKVASKYRPYDLDAPYTKGVENDFVLIMKNANRGLSLGLAFNYIGLKEPNLTASIKKGNTNSRLEISQMMDMETFKSKINQMNKWLAEKSENLAIDKNAPIQILEMYSEIFLEKKMDLQKEIKAKQKKVDDIIESKSSELNIAAKEKKHISASTKYEKAIETIDNEIKGSIEYQKIKQLKSDLKNLEDRLAHKKSTLEKEADIKGLRQAKMNDQEDLNDTKLMLKIEVEKALEETPRVLVNRIKKSM